MHPDDGVVCRSFATPTGGVEHFIVIHADASLDFTGQVRSVESRYRATLDSLKLPPQSSVFRRVFVSDVINQASLVRESTLFDPDTAVSLVQQAPLPGSKLALLAYHVDSPSPIVKQRLSPKHLLVEKNGHKHLWSTRLCTCDSETANSSEKQTREIFNDLIDTLASRGSTLLDHCVRTWIYMKDVDVFYKGMVESRRDLFREQGLSTSTHYISSTGIEGACAHRWDLVSMDAYSHLDLVRGQMSFLNDFDHLCPTKDYNVTFERGTRIAYADRAHYYISGTASIDSQGEVVHPGDVIRQLERSLKNVDVLLRSGRATFADMMYLLVYLRDPADYEAVNAYFAIHHPDLPIVIVQGAVCRPAWLIEIEGVAVNKQDEPSLPAF